MKENIVYQFYYESSRIVDHDEDYNTVYETCRNNIGAFYDFNIGLEYFKHKFPTKTICYDRIVIMDGTV